MKNKTPSKAIKRHKRFVKRLKVALMSMAFLMTLALILWPQIAKQKDFLTNLMKQTNVSFSRQASIDMTAVEFVSEDKKGQPFTITSEKVLETDTVQKLVKLDQPVGRMSLNSGVKLLINSPFALFYQEQEVLLFEEKVKITSDNGYTAQMSNVTLNHKEESAKSPNKISISGPRGSLNAMGFHLYDNGDKIDFYGKSKAIFKEGKTYILNADDGIEVRQTEKTIRAKKNASLIEEVNKLYGDEIIAFLKETGKNKYELKRLESLGHVRILTETETVTGNWATYDIEKETATITGDVKVVRKEGEMQGHCAIINMKTGTSVMSSAPADMEPKRVQGILLPTELKKDKVKPEDK